MVLVLERAKVDRSMMAMPVSVLMALCAKEFCQNTNNFRDQTR